MNIPTYLSGQIQTKAYRILRAHVYDSLNQYELNPTHWALLGAILQTSEGVTLTKMAEYLGVKAPLVTNMANDLIARGLIKKVAHGHDARAKLLVILPKGRTFIETVESSLRQNLSHLLKGASTNDLESYQSVLATIIKNGSTD